MHLEEMRFCTCAPSIPIVLCRCQKSSASLGTQVVMNKGTLTPKMVKPIGSCWICCLLPFTNVCLLYVFGDQKTSEFSLAFLKEWIVQDSNLRGFCHVPDVMGNIVHHVMFESLVKIQCAGTTSPYHPYMVYLLVPTFSRLVHFYGFHFHVGKNTIVPWIHHVIAMMNSVETNWLRFEPFWRKCLILLAGPNDVFMSLGAGDGKNHISGWCFQVFFIFTPIWGSFPFWQINVFEKGSNHQLGFVGCWISPKWISLFQVMQSDLFNPKLEVTNNLWVRVT